MTAAYFDGLNEKLLAAIPPTAHRVLELGCANGRLGEAFKGLHPGIHWTGVDRSAEALDRAAARLDRVINADLASADRTVLGEGYDSIVIGDLLEHLPDPVHLLREISACSANDATLVCCVPNMTHISVLERLLAGDLSYDAEGLLDATHVKFLSPASTIKLFLDSGWLPNLRDSYMVGHPHQDFLRAVIAAAAQIGVPSKTAARNISIYQMIIDCIKAPPVPTSHAAPFSVVVPVTNPAQLALNVTRSPGLHEVKAPVIEVRGATSAAQAFAQGAQKAETAWVVFAHQDVYFPVGSGHAVASVLGSVPAALADKELIGFAGMSTGPTNKAECAGLVIDRLARFDHPATHEALSIDEFAVAMTPRSDHRIDAALGWHLWGTDLCISAARRPGARAARIVRVPLFHNSYNDGALTPAFYRSADILMAKYADLVSIPTLCGTLSAQSRN
jgi:2-polyprenyl-3-methyl-5-hydroxy-6-metoxy-1,4-benzoquinol methylase